MRWDVSARELYQRPASGAVSCGLYRGRIGSPALAGRRELGIEVKPERPIEPAADGCPGGWYRTAYVNSLAKYLRRRTGDGGRVPNPLLARADCWQIEEAVLHFEAEEERWYAYRAEVDQQRWRATQKG